MFYPINMPKKPETLLKEKVLADLRTIDCCWYAKIQQTTIRGTPDILACINGYFIAIELKTELGKLDKLQSYTLAKISKSGGLAYTVTPSNWQDTFDDLAKISYGD